MQKMQDALNEKKDKPTPKRYDAEFRRSVIEHWLGTGKTAKVVAQEFGVQVWNLRDWKRRFAPAPPAPGAPLPETLEGLKLEIHNLRQQLVRTTSQREILKKTLAIISEAQPTGIA